MNKAMISTWKMSYDGMLKAKDILQQDGSVQAAILAAIQDVEAREEFISVGHGGLPNAQGHVQLDSAYMNLKATPVSELPQRQSNKEFCFSYVLLFQSSVYQSSVFCLFSPYYHS